MRPTANPAVVEPCQDIHKIPIKNLWFLLVYAMEMPELAGKMDVALEKSPDLPDLISALLAHVVEDRLHANLTRSYVPKNDVLTRLRGRIDLVRTITQRTLDHGEIVCRYEDLSIDTPRNRFVLSALTKVRLLDVRDATVKKCLKLAHVMENMGVKPMHVPLQSFNIETYNRNDAKDKLMVGLSAMVFNLCLPTEVVGKHTFRQAVRNDVLLRHVFEKAIGQFYKYHLKKSDGWMVSTGERILWPVTESSNDLALYLPTMETDITLRNAVTGRHIVIDTKFTSILQPGRYGDSKFKSGYIYQMYAYLKSQSENAGCKEGLLLHPSLGIHLDERAVIQGDTIRFTTIDLSQSSDKISEDLLNLF